MKKIISLLSALVISVVSFAGISNADSKKPIVIPTHNWSSQIVMEIGRASCRERV